MGRETGGESISRNSNRQVPDLDRDAGLRIERIRRAKRKLGVGFATSYSVMK